MAIISEETKATAAPPGNNNRVSFNLSNQLETHQGLAEDNSALLITAVQLCPDFLSSPWSLHSDEHRRKSHNALKSFPFGNSHINPSFFHHSSSPFVCHMRNKGPRISKCRFNARKFEITIPLSAGWPPRHMASTFHLRLPSSQTSASGSVGARRVCWQRRDKCGYFNTVWDQKTDYLHEKPVPLSPRRALLQEDISNAIKCAKHLLW